MSQRRGSRKFARTSRGMTRSYWLIASSFSKLKLRLFLIGCGNLKVRSTKTLLSLLNGSDKERIIIHYALERDGDYHDTFMEQ